MVGGRRVWPAPLSSLDLCSHPSLSGLELLSEHLDPNLLGRLKKLKELDLSNNLLETLPPNLGLSHLRILRCTNNQLGDVTALHQFPELEELSLEGNPFLTVREGGFCQPEAQDQEEPAGVGWGWGWGQIGSPVAGFKLTVHPPSSLELLILLPPTF